MLSVTVVLGVLVLTMGNSDDYAFKPYAHMSAITSRTSLCHLDGKAFTVVSSAHVT